MLGCISCCCGCINTLLPFLSRFATPPNIAANFGDHHLLLHPKNVGLDAF
jgi:hypothetical protein